MKKIAIATTICVMAALAYYVLFVPIRFRLESTSPSGKVEVRGLRFQGRAPHDLDGTLRLYIGDFKQQTTIEWTDKLSVSWDINAPSETFEVLQGDDLLMRWQVLDGHASCIKGEGYLTADPYKE
jgi:hypothetical protein